MNLNSVDQNDDNIEISSLQKIITRKMYVSAIVAILCKWGTFLTVFTSELVYVNLNYSSIIKSLQDIDLDTEKFIEYSKGLKISICVVLFICAFELAIFTFLRKKAYSFKIISLLELFVFIFVYSLIESITNVIRNFVKLKNRPHNYLVPFSFKPSSFGDYFLQFSTIYIEAPPIICLIYPYYTYDLIVSLYLRFGYTFDPHLEGVKLLLIKAIPESLKEQIKTICNTSGIDPMSIIVPAEPEFDTLNRIYKINNTVYFPNSILNNYENDGLIGALSLFITEKNSLITAMLPDLSALHDLVMILFLLWLLKLSNTLKNSFFGKICTIRILNGIEFVLHLIFNMIIRVRQMNVDSVAMENEYKNQVVGYLKNKATLETPYYSPILKFISNSDSIYGRLKKNGI